MSRIPDYKKKIRDMFNFHYWVVEVLKLGKSDPSEHDEMFTVIEGEVYWIRFYPRNMYINRWEYNKERMYKTLRKLEPIENDLTKNISQEILSYRNSWNEERDPDTGHCNIRREITVAALKSDLTKWGLAIYKPDDYILEESTVERKDLQHTINFRDAFEITISDTISKTKKINFTKKLGQAWAIKDFEGKFGVVRVPCGKEHCPFGVFDNPEDRLLRVLTAGVYPGNYRERVYVKMTPRYSPRFDCIIDEEFEGEVSSNRTCMYQMGEFCMYHEWKDKRQM